MKDEGDLSNAEGSKFHVDGAALVAFEPLDAIVKAAIEQTQADPRPALALAEAFAIVRAAISPLRSGEHA